MGRVGCACDPGMRVDLPSHKLETRISGRALPLGDIAGPAIPGSRDPAISPATMDKNSRRRGACRNNTWDGAFDYFSNGAYRGRFIRRTSSAGYGNTPGEEPYGPAFVSFHFHVGLLMRTCTHGL